MPTHQQIAGDTETDLGWAFTAVETDPDTGERIAIIITCKGCAASTRYPVILGGIVNAFAHSEPCAVLDEVRRQTRAHLDRARAAAAKETS